MNDDRESAALGVEREARFSFGENWAKFLETLDEEKIELARESLARLLGTDDLSGKTFLDIGSGSGLSSLVAYRMGATVTSFDYDTQSVACSAELAERYGDGKRWTVQQGSALDAEFMRGLGSFDIVHSWGVLHHTGAMWNAIALAEERVTEGGNLVLALYNDQGAKSHLWWLIKAFHNLLPRGLNTGFAYMFGYLVYAANILRYTLKLQPMKAIRPILEYRKGRGMSLTRDIVDWVGGFPFEFVRDDTMRHYLEARGYQEVYANPATSLGCHEWNYLKRG